MGLACALLDDDNNRNGSWQRGASAFVGWHRIAIKEMGATSRPTEHHHARVPLPWLTAIGSIRGLERCRASDSCARRRRLFKSSLSAPCPQRRAARSNKTDRKYGRLEIVPQNEHRTNRCRQLPRRHRAHFHASVRHQGRLRRVERLRPSAIAVLVARRTRLALVALSTGQVVDVADVAHVVTAARTLVRDGLLCHFGDLGDSGCTNDQCLTSCKHA